MKFYFIYPLRRLQTFLAKWEKANTILFTSNKPTNITKKHKLNKNEIRSHYNQTIINPNFPLIKTSKTTQKPFCPFLSKASFANRLTANKLVSIVKGIWCKNPYGAAQLSQGSSNLNFHEWKIWIYFWENKLPC